MKNFSININVFLCNEAQLVMWSGERGHELVYSQLQVLKYQKTGDLGHR